MGVLFIILGYISMALASVCGIGFGLWDMIDNDSTFLQGLWFGFKVWASMIVVGLIMLTGGFTVEATK